MNPTSVGLIAKSYGTFLRKRGIGNCVLGHDNRKSSEKFYEATKEGLLSTGIDVIGVGIILTPMMYWAQYHYANGWQTVIEPTLSAPAAVLPIGDVVACGNGLSAHATAFETRLFASNALPALMPHAIHIASLARVALAQGQVIASHEAQPLYLRNKVALTTQERLAKVAA